MYLGEASDECRHEHCIAIPFGASWKPLKAESESTRCMDFAILSNLKFFFVGATVVVTLSRHGNAQHVFEMDLGEKMLSWEVNLIFLIFLKKGLIMTPKGYMS